MKRMATAAHGVMIAKTRHATKNTTGSKVREEVPQVLLKISDKRQRREDEERGNEERERRRDRDRDRR